MLRIMLINLPSLKQWLNSIFRPEQGENLAKQIFLGPLRLEDLAQKEYIDQLKTEIKNRSHLKT